MTMTLWVIAMIAVVIAAAWIYKIFKDVDEAHLKDMEQKLHIRHIKRKNK